MYDKTSSLYNVVQEVGYGKDGCGAALRELVRGTENRTVSEKALIELGIMESLRDILGQETDFKILYDACSLLTNIVYVCNDRRAGEYFLEYLGILVHCRRTEISSQAIWAIGNIVSDGDGNFLQAVGHECHRDVIDRLLHYSIGPDLNDQSVRGFIYNAIWTLLVFTRYGKYLTIETAEEIIKSVSPFAKIGMTWNDDLCSAVGNLLKVFSSLRGLVFSELSVFLAETMAKTTDLKEFRSAATLGGILISDEEPTFTDYFLLRGLMRNVKRWLGKDPLLDSELCWTLSNVVAGTPVQGRQVVDSGILTQVLNLADRQTTTKSARKEITYLLKNLTCNAEELAGELPDEIITPLMKTVCGGLFGVNDDVIRTNCVEIMVFVKELHGERAADVLNLPENKELLDLVQRYESDD